EWMHELPPMRHVTRGTVVDVHHAILPLTARISPDSRKLLASSRPIVDDSAFKILSPVDMVLHAASHLFHNEELSSGLRDLIDLDSLLNEFSAEQDFWKRLIDRAFELQLSRALYYALHCLIGILATSIPGGVLAAISSASPPRAVAALMSVLFARALRPHHPSARDALTPIAVKLLYVRAHWLRMPPLLLLRHLTIKAFRREEIEDRDRV
ncbi:MAG TPA: nucleotidyltransferase family protein, partial [Casimicrobiaceae bacterium]|nr:nucleotidyltransferase family protein [Casimicrobiaceae bacterium]